MSEQKLFHWQVLAVAAAIFGARLWLIHVYGNDTPHLDQWNDQAVRVFLPWLNGQFSLEALFATHNEHRPVLTRLITLYLLILNKQWDPLLEMTFSALFHTLSAALILLLFGKHLRVRRRAPLLLGIAALWMLPYGWENSLWGFQMAWYLMALFSLLAVWGLVLHAPYSRNWWLGGLCAFLAFFNLASGFFVLLAIIALELYLLVADRAGRAAHLPTLLYAGLVVLLCLPLLGKAPNLDYFHAADAGEFFLALARNLGWPWIYRPWLGPLLFLPLAWLAWRVARRCRVPDGGEALVLVLGGWVILQALILAYGRGRFGDWAHSRYMDILALGVVANLGAWYALLRDGGPRAPYLALAWGLLLGVGLADLSWRNTWPALQDKRQESENARQVIRDLLRTGDLDAFLARRLPGMLGQSPYLLPALLANPPLRAALPLGLTVPPPLQAGGPGQTFLPDALPPELAPYRQETALGSYQAAEGRFVSEALEFQQGFIALPVAGHLGEDGLRLVLQTEDGGTPLEVRPAAPPGAAWQTLYLPNPYRPFRLIAEDRRADAWFAFAAPRGVGSLSLGNHKLLALGPWLALAGVAALLGLLLYGGWLERKLSPPRAHPYNHAH